MQVHAQAFCILLLLVTSFSSPLLFGQPSNDNCSNPTLLMLGKNAATCIPVSGDTRGTEDATLVKDAPQVCSGSWYTDDVWFNFETGDVAPAYGVTVEIRLDSTSGTEVIEHGMAIYQDCDSESQPIDCFSDEPGRRMISFPASCIAPNSSYLIRIWSAPDPRTNEGTFSICAYETAESNSYGPRVIYEENFDEGLNGWESISQSQSFDINTGEMVDDNWLWTNTGCFASAFGSSDCLKEVKTACQENGVVGFPAGFYQSERDGDPGNIGLPPYPNANAFLISPPIDLSKESCVNLTWSESASFLSGGTLSSLGSYVQYSIDGGETWNNPSNAIGSPDVSINYGGEYVRNALATTNALKRGIPLIGAAGHTDVRIRFGFDGDFYFWIVDNIRIVESTAADGVALSNSFARASINPMSIHMVDSYDFLIDIENLSCEDLINANVNMTITNSSGDEMHNVDLEYETIMSDSLAKNQSFMQPFTPPAIVDDYTARYTLSADGDDDFSNNVKTFSASVVDEMVFRKENGNANGQFSPNTSRDVFWEQDEPFRWEMGNIFFAPNGRNINDQLLSFNEISFQLANPTEIVGDRLLVWLYEIRDNNFDNIIHKDDPTEITILGVCEYLVTGLENGLITVQLEPFNSNLIIKANTHYMATVANTTQVIRSRAMEIAADDSYDYSAAILKAQQTALASGNLTDNRYAHSFAITKENYFRIGPGNANDNTTGNFNQSSTPVIRLGYIQGPFIDSAVSINKAIKVAISPNPTAAELTVNLSVEEATDMEISIIDLAGKVIIEKSFREVTQLNEVFNASNLPNGVYMIHINTQDGVQTEKFVVSK